MRVIAMGGEPGSGKTTLMNAIRSESKLKKFLYEKILNYEKSKDGKVIIFGKYTGDKYDGTDRISMAVQPVAEKFIRKRKSQEVTILFEGDRLFNNSFLTFIAAICPIAIVILSTADKIKWERYRAREDDRNKTFLKSKKTKTKNIFKSFPTIVLNSEEEEDFIQNSECLKELVRCKDDASFIKAKENCKKKSLKGLKSKRDLSDINNIFK